MDSNDLIQNVYTYFLNAYRQAAPGGSQGEVVAFEPIGFSPGCSALTGNNVAGAALEEVSHFTDVLPQLEGGIFTRTMRTIAFTYGNMLDVAEPTSAASIATFSDFKSQAQEAYRATLGSYDGPTAFHPTYPTPIDWYDLTKTGNWQSYSYDASAQTPAPATPVPVAPNVRIQWHILPEEMRPLVFQRPIQGRPPMAGVYAHPMFMRSQMTLNRAIPTNVAAPAATSAHLAPMASTQMVEITSLNSVANIATQTTPQPVETPKFTMSFDYCVVQLRRPWLSGDLLATPGWYVPGAHRGDYASGGPANTGPFAVLPTAFIAVKNLVIDAAWSENDAAARTKAGAFGPFSLLGLASDDKNAMQCPGLQSIAWICSPQPHLPPDSDPSLVTAATTPPGNASASSGSASPTQPTSGSSGNPSLATAATAPAGNAPTSSGSGSPTQPASGSSGNPSLATAAAAPPGNASTSSGPASPTQPTSGSSDPVREPANQRVWAG
jgi:hypothetical protein